MHPIDKINVERAGMAEHGRCPLRKAAMRVRSLIVRADIRLGFRDNRANYALADAATDLSPQKIARDNTSITIKEFFIHKR